MVCQRRPYFPSCCPAIIANRAIREGRLEGGDWPRLLEFTWLPDWHEDEPQSVVRFDLEEKDGVTTVRLTHSGLTSERARENYKGWPWLLAFLQAYVENKAPGSAG